MSAKRMSGARARVRARLAVAAAVVAAVTLGLAGAVAGGSAAFAADAVLPDGPKVLVIHPGGDAGGAGRTGDGLPPAADAPKSPAGYAYQLRRVPGLTLSKTVDWNRAVEMTAADALPLVADQPVVSGELPGDGTSVFAGLETGLYLVEETAAPNGVVRSLPFLVALPLPHPTRAGEWLTTVHLFPKNASVDVELGVSDHAAVTCGDTVTWTALGAIPAQDTITQYRMQQIMADGVVFNGKLGGVRVSITGQPPLTAGVDYDVSQIEAEGRWGFETSFTAAGLAKLVVDTGAQVRVSYDTHVERSGEFVNEVRLFAGDAGAVTDTATTRFGPLRILVHEKGHPDNLIEGAAFRLFTSEADARGGRNAVEFADGADLRTSADGLITVACLRASNHADGLDRAAGSELYRDYFATPVSYPAGWTGDDVILRGGVTSVAEPETLRAVVWKAVTPPVLTETGARIAAAAALGAVLLAAGVLVVVRRRGRDGESAA